MLCPCALPVPCTIYDTVFIHVIISIIEIDIKSGIFRHHGGNYLLLTSSNRPFLAMSASHSRISLLLASLIIGTRLDAIALVHAQEELSGINGKCDVNGSCPCKAGFGGRNCAFSARALYGHDHRVYMGLRQNPMLFRALDLQVWINPFKNLKFQNCVQWLCAPFARQGWNFVNDSVYTTLMSKVCKADQILMFYNLIAYHSSHADAKDLRKIYLCLANRKCINIKYKRLIALLPPSYRPPITLLPRPRLPPWRWAPSSSWRWGRGREHRPEFWVTGLQPLGEEAFSSVWTLGWELQSFGQGHVNRLLIFNEINLYAT